MAKIDDKAMALARVYSDAILALAEQSGQAESLRDELDDLAKLVERDSAFAEFLSSPMIATEARMRTIDKLFRGKLSDLLVNSLQVMNRKDRMGLLPALALSYRAALDAAKNVAEVRVSTAVPLTDALRGELQEVTAKISGKKTTLVESVDPSLIGGMIVHIGDRKYDTSVRARLRSVSRKLMERASREIQQGRTCVEGAAV